MENNPPSYCNCPLSSFSCDEIVDGWSINQSGKHCVYLHVRCRRCHVITTRTVLTDRKAVKR